MLRNWVSPSGRPSRIGTLIRVEHVGERDVLRIGHVGVPALAGIAEADRLAVLGHVGEDHDLGRPGSWNRLATLISSSPNLRAEAREGLRRPDAARGSTARRARRARAGSAEVAGPRAGCARSMSSIVAPRILPARRYAHASRQPCPSAPRDETSIPRGSARCRCHPTRRHQLCAASTNRLRKMPSPVISTSTVSPAFRSGEVPSVPIQRTSPGTSVM